MNLLLSDYLKIDADGWTGWVHRHYRWEQLRWVLEAGQTGAGGPTQKVGSSDTAAVYRGTIEREGGPAVVYIKDHLPRTWLERLKGALRPGRAVRAFKAGLVLQSNGLSTPGLAAVLERKGGRNVLVTEAMPPSEPLYTFFVNGSEASDGERRRLVADLAKVVGRMHSKGIAHGDLRGGNVFVSMECDSRRFYLIDNERTIQYARLPKRQRVKNLVQLNMLVCNVTDAERLRFLVGYARAAGLSKGQVRPLAKAVARKTAKRLTHRARTRLGMPDAFQQDHWKYKRAKLGRLKAVFRCDFCEGTASHEFLANVARLMEGDFLKDDRATRVVRRMYHGHDIVIKRYNYQGLWHSLRHTIKGSRAEKNWRFGHRLADARIACAPPLGMVEERQFGLIRQSYIITGYVGGPLLHDVMTRPDYSPQERQAVIEKTEALLGELGRMRMTHNDVKPANFIIHEGRPVLIDLDSMQQHRIGFYSAYQYRKMTRYFRRRLQGKAKS